MEEIVYNKNGKFYFEFCCKEIGPIDSEEEAWEEYYWANESLKFED